LKEKTMSKPGFGPDTENDDDLVEIDVDEKGSGLSADDIEVEVVDDTPESDRGRKPLAEPVDEPTDEELQSYGERARKRIEKLTHSRHDERRAREAAERTRDEAARMAQAMASEVQQLREIVKNGSKAYNENAVKLAEAELASARQKLIEAQESYDNLEIVKAQDELFEARIKLDRVKNTPAAPLQNVPSTVQTAPAQAKEPPIDETSLRWQQKNQWFGAPGYEEITGFALALEHKMVQRGSDPKSAEHFEQIDARLKETFPKVFGQTQAPPNRSKPSVVAPASRVTGARKVTLTKTQLALAKQWGLTPQQYAAEVLKLEKSNG